MKTFSVKMDKELSDKIAVRAKEDDRSESSVIRQAVRAFLFAKTVQPKSTKITKNPKEAK